MRDCAAHEEKQKEFFAGCSRALRQAAAGQQRVFAGTSTSSGTAEAVPNDVGGGGQVL